MKMVVAVVVLLISACSKNPMRFNWGGALAVSSHPCYKTKMPNLNVKWVLFQYDGGHIVELSKPFKSREEAEQARLKFPERKRRAIAVGVLKTK